MEAHEYATMAALEADYWWYRGLHGVLLDTLRACGVQPDARILDAGCGTGGNLISLRRAYADVYGFDFSPNAAPFWAERGLMCCCLGSVNEIPFAANTFAAVTCIDVLESDGVDPARAAAELVRVTRPGGVVLLTVPAYKWLLTEQHHRAVHASRRYTLPEAVDLLRGLPVTLLRATHVFALLFPPIAAYRLALKAFDHPDPDTPPRSELSPLPAPINGLLSGVMRFERALLRRTNLPIGTSILIVARKALDS